LLFCGGAQKSELATQLISVAGIVRINRVLVFPGDPDCPALDCGMSISLQAKTPKP
jgi:hypothetical protein